MLGFLKATGPGNVCQVQSHSKEALRGHFVKLWRWSLGLNRDPRMSEMPGTWDICCRKLQAWSRASPGQRLYVLQETEIGRQGSPDPLDSRWSHHKPQMINMDLQDLLFVLLGFGLTISSYVPPFPCWNWEFISCHGIYWRCVASILFHKKSQLRVCLESQLTIELWAAKHCWNC